MSWSDQQRDKRRYPAKRSKCFVERLDAEALRANFTRNIEIDSQFIAAFDRVIVALREHADKNPTKRIADSVRKHMGEGWQVYYGTRSVFKDEVELTVTSTDPDHPALSYGAGGIRLNFKKDYALTVKMIDDLQVQYTAPRTQRIDQLWEFIDKAGTIAAEYNAFLPFYDHVANMIGSDTFWRNAFVDDKR